MHTHLMKVAANARLIEEFERALWAGRHPEWGAGTSLIIGGNERQYRNNYYRSQTPDRTFGFEWRASVKWNEDPPPLTHALTVTIGGAKDAPLVESIRLTATSAHFTRTYQGEVEGHIGATVWRRGLRELVRRMGSELSPAFDNTSSPTRTFECPCQAERHLQVAEGIGHILIEELAQLPLPMGA
jgi:hypothetical protein